MEKTRERKVTGVKRKGRKNVRKKKGGRTIFGEGEERTSMEKDGEDER